jgi:hypothetical protein
MSRRSSAAEVSMRLTDALKSILLLLAGAAACAVGLLLSRDESHHDVFLSPEQMQRLEARIDRLEAAILESGKSTGPIDALASSTSPGPVRSEERQDGDSLRLLSEIRDELKALVYGAGHSPTAVAAGIAKNTDALAKTVELDGLDSRKLSQRHFCETPAQVYATYGMPDMKDGGPGAQSWRYRIDGSDKWMVFLFVDGRLFDVSIPQGSGR